MNPALLAEVTAFLRRQALTLASTCTDATENDSCPRCIALNLIRQGQRALEQAGR